MDVLDIVFWALVVGLGSFLVWLIYGMINPPKEEKEYFKEQKKRLEDERIYDPETGRFYTLEELENEEKYDFAKANELFSEEEIEKVYFNDDAFPRTHNYLLSQSYEVVIDTNLFEEFHKTAIANTYESFYFAHNYKISDQSILSIISVDYYLKGSYFTDLFLLGTVPLREKQPHFLLEPRSLKDRLLRIFDQANSKKLDNWYLVSFNQDVQDDFANIIIGLLPKNNNIDLELVDDSDGIKVAIEVKEDRLYIKSVNYLDVEQVAGMISIIKNLENI